MKNQLIWVKTVLSVYRYLERICGSIDKIIMQSALGSADILGQNYFYNNTAAISEKLIDLSERKITLINLKVLVDDILGELQLKDSIVLIQRYLDEMKMKDIAQKDNISIRSVFRRLENAENAFGHKLKLKGYDSQKLNDFLKNEQWILNAYNKFEKSDVDDFALSNSFLAKAVSM